ncbi:GNAT family N-acetyltransferase [Glutamicibacter mishrai]|uniref:GNAT family N-acetyltransferase n=1 Tax=Glutamicibacter mishrai TaxID=1775880 RepID=UPI0020CF093F|nr:GNAT family N-acetyltransferase [Glutamicibacter mishrai]UTT38659.1 GNAT family N-acetyltransferase [Glutamicibacter mishrai]
MEVRRITQGQCAALQRMVESNLEYSRRVGGTELAPEAASEALSALPPAVLNSQKVDLGLWDGQELVAFADVILGWPAESVAHVGLLMTHGARQGGGLGRVMHDAVIDLVGRTPNIQSLRLSIVDTNADLAEPFWAKLGYEPTGESVPYVSGSVESTARIWTRPVVIA